MGSFNVSCGMSGLTINEEDKVGVQILTPSTVTVDPRIPHIKINGFPKSPLYSHEIFNPYLPAFYATYDDYGLVKDIVESDTTRFLEEKFGLDIQSFSEILLRFSSIYDPHGQILGNFSSSTVSTSKKHLKDPMVSCGFDFVRLDDQGEHYSFSPIDGDEYFLSIKASEETPLECVFSSPDGVTKSFSAHDMSEMLEAFSDLSGTLPGFDEKLWSNIRELSNMTVMFFSSDVYEQVSTVAKENRQTDGTNSLENGDWENFCAKISQIESTSGKPSGVRDKVLSLLLGTVGRLSGLAGGMERDDYISLLLPGSFFVERFLSLPRKNYGLLAKHFPNPKGDISTLVDVDEVMLSLNRMYLPNYCGTQDGDNRVSLAAAKAIQGILDRRMAEIEG